MKTPEEILNEVAVENMKNIQQMVTTKQLAVIAMIRYAKLYHESKVENNVDLHNIRDLFCPNCGSELQLEKKEVTNSDLIKLWQLD